VSSAIRNLSLLSKPPSFAPATTATQPLILASASPRRAQLLRTIGVAFTVMPSEAPEPEPAASDHARPAEFVERLALAKARASPAMAGGTVVGGTTADALVLAADTIVWCDGLILNKPQDAPHAVEMLRMLRGRTHTVFTGLCLCRADAAGGNFSRVEHEATRVTFGRLSDRWIDAYVATGEPMDKAGGYAAQGRGALLIERIEGDYWNVVGLPLARLGRMLEEAGAPVESWW